MEPFLLWFNKIQECYNNVDTDKINAIVIYYQLKRNGMDISIRKIGNSKGVVIPASLLKELGLDVNDKANVKAENGCLVIEPKPRPKNKYSLDELLAKCDENAPVPQEIKDWDPIESVGDEI